MSLPRRVLSVLLGGAIAVGTLGCGSSPDVAEDTKSNRRAGRPIVFVVNYPLQFFAERIAGGQIQVVLPVDPGSDPAYWTPSSDVISRMQEADLILCNGASYAKWTDTVSLPASKMVDTTAEIHEQYIALEENLTHSHGPSGEHTHEGTAFTTWLDPEIAAFQAEQVQEVFSRLLPENAVSIRENNAALQRELNDLHRKIATLVEAKTDRPIVFSHPVYQYLVRKYQLNGRSVHWEPDEVPSESSWEELEALLEHYPAQWMIWEGKPNPATAERLQRLGVQSVVFDPCGNVPQQGDFLSVMKQNVENLRKVYAD